MSNEKKTINAEGLSDESVKALMHAVMVKVYGYWRMEPIMRE